jgi:hypothetical protein
VLVALVAMVVLVDIVVKLGMIQVLVKHLFVLLKQEDVHHQVKVQCVKVYNILYVQVQMVLEVLTVVHV